MKGIKFVVSILVIVSIFVGFNTVLTFADNTIVRIFVYLLIFFLPSSPPSLVNFSKDGIIIPNNWITIDAVMYGVIDIANNENLENAPPDL